MAPRKLRQYRHLAAGIRSCDTTVIPTRHNSGAVDIGDGLAGSSLIQGVARQPEAQGRLQTLFFITVGLVEAAYFINLAFMALFVFVTGQS